MTYLNKVALPNVTLLFIQFVSSLLNDTLFSQSQFLFDNRNLLNNTLIKTRLELLAIRILKSDIVRHDSSRDDSSLVLRIIMCLSNYHKGRLLDHKKEDFKL